MATPENTSELANLAYPELTYPNPDEALASPLLAPRDRQALPLPKAVHDLWSDKDERN